MLTNALTKAGYLLLGVCLGVLATGRTEGLKIPDSSVVLEGAVGESRYDRAPAGMWWQPEQNNQNIFKDAARQIRGGFRLNPAATVYVGLVNLGRAHTRATAVFVPGDDATKRDYSKDVNRAECKQSFNGDNCLYHAAGDGGATRALSLTLGWKLPSIGLLTPELEAGLLAYRMVWQEMVCPTDCDKNDSWRLNIVQHTGYYLSPMFGARVHADRCFGILPKDSTCFIGTYYYARISDHLPISAGVGKTAQSWMGGIQVTL